VLEITERTAIKDYPRFKEYLKAFRERGFRFAVDDAGSGYAGLGSIANLEPDYIKLDISLIANIDTNFLKQNLVETMVSFANSQGTQVIAEGVERREEFETVRQLGVHFTQGFLFHRPATPACRRAATVRACLAFRQPAGRRCATRRGRGRLNGAAPPYPSRASDCRRHGRAGLQRGEPPAGVPRGTVLRLRGTSGAVASRPGRPMTGGVPSGAARAATV
jgi:hypothetical protein